ncbi:hypothetical protein LJ756_11460 [Arthrobacter sp. zg-Y411]|uniref:hypothetical protein n=1 Tax=Arthrobacter zhangbolii TaxID=2886936 RepID=UPI001D1462C4|nr:hypothetical protein [Arthrobacter zhangbolii]
MNFLYSLALAVTPAPDSTLAPGVDEKDVTPGLLGFIFTLVLALAIIFLIRDMTKRIRRVRYREQAAQALAEREAGMQAPGESADGAKSAPGSVPSPDAPAAGEPSDTGNTFPR